MSDQPNQATPRKASSYVDNIQSLPKTGLGDDCIQDANDLLLSEALEVQDLATFEKAVDRIEEFSDSQLSLIARVIADHGISSIHSV